MRIPAGRVQLEGDLHVAPGSRGVIVFAHGSGSSRLSPRNRQVAEYLRSTGVFGTLLFDLLTPEEDRDYETRFDIGLLARRLDAATTWLQETMAPSTPAIGLFGASTGAAAALVAAAERDDIAAVVSRGGRPDLADAALGAVRAPTLLIVGGADTQVLARNESAMARMPGVVELAVVPGAGHLFEEPSALDEASRLTMEWFERHVK